MNKSVENPLLLLQNYAGVDIKNFTTSWSDGLAFNALLHRWKPDLFNFNVIARKHPNARLENAFRIAQEHLGIERLLDPEGNDAYNYAVENNNFLFLQTFYDVYNIIICFQTLTLQCQTKSP